MRDHDVAPDRAAAATEAMWAPPACRFDPLGVGLVAQPGVRAIIQSRCRASGLTSVLSGWAWSGCRAGGLAAGTIFGAVGRHNAFTPAEAVKPDNNSECSRRTAAAVCWLQTHRRLIRRARARAGRSRSSAGWSRSPTHPRGRSDRLAWPASPSERYLVPIGGVPTADKRAPCASQLPGSGRSSLSSISA
jgi:hypothetical protein